MPSDELEVDPQPDAALMTRHAHYADLGEIKAKLEERRDGGHLHVAFSAYVNSHPNTQSIAGHVVPFGGLITNVGYGYNTRTNAFTAPYGGIYFFFVALDISKDFGGVKLLRNGRYYAAAHNDYRENTHISVGVTMTLNARDVIKVTYETTGGHVDSGISSVFTGFKLA
nr:hypothetical protein BaRGS_006710 [Batillaria attramentaria]